MKDRSSIVATLYEDAFRRTGSKRPFTALNALRVDPTLKFVTSFRIVKKYGKGSLLGFVAYLAYKYYRKNYGLQIPLEVRLGRALLMPHFGGIVINSKARIGDNCTILHGVTIGNVTTGKRAGAPIIESRVYLGPDAVVVGGIVVGRGSVIAPGAFVNFDVPAGSLVIGNPGRIVRTSQEESFPSIKNAISYLE